MNPVTFPNAEKQTHKRALGRGLSALIPQPAAPSQAEGEGHRQTVLQVPIESIRRDAAQPRKHFDEQALRELADSIRAQGILQPVLVRKEGDGYCLIAGERRWRAAQLAGLQEIPAIVRDVSEPQAFELALVENLQRSDLNPIEEAEGYRRLVDEFGLTQEQVSQRVGKERSSVANALRLLGLPDPVKQMVAEGVLNMGHARALLGLPQIPEMVALAERIAAQKLSVREAERLVKVSKAPAPTREEAPRAGNPQARHIVEDLQRVLGTKVRLVDRGGKGTIEVEYFSYADLDRILELIRR